MSKASAILVEVETINTYGPSVWTVVASHTREAVALADRARRCAADNYSRAYRVRFEG